MTVKPSAIICADWGAKADKRAVFVADVCKKTVSRLQRDAWSLSSVLQEAEILSKQGTVLAAFDAPFGVPASHLAALRQRANVNSPATFLELLKQPPELFFEPCGTFNDWTPERPFFVVPPGQSGLTNYSDAAARFSVSLKREIDEKTKGKSVFVKAGIPGSVGSAAIDLWAGLAKRFKENRPVLLWPFDGQLDKLLQESNVVIGEIYPRAVYATALSDAPKEWRPPLDVAKTKKHVRLYALNVLSQASWVGRLGVTLCDLGYAEANEDDFDACVTACALLRSVLEGVPLSVPELEDEISEGGILGVGSVNLGLPTRPLMRATDASTESRTPRPAPHRRVVSTEGTRQYVCPIPGCGKRFLGSRGGWDAHVAPPRLHPAWHPELSDADQRKLRFRTEFPEFFS